MTANGWSQIVFFVLVIFLITKPMGIFMEWVFNREKTFLDPLLRPLEELVYRLIGVDERHEMRWSEYTIAMLLFSAVSMMLLYLMERTQAWVPFNPQKLPNVEPGLAFGTAASFTTNTNWQSYVPENHHELFHPNGWLGLSQLCFRGRGHCARDRSNSRHRAPRDR